MNQYTLQENPNGEKELQKDGKPLVCPFRTGAAGIIKTQLGKEQSVFLNQSCTNSCPLFVEDINHISIICGNRSVNIKISKHDT